MEPLQRLNPMHPTNGWPVPITSWENTMRQAAVITFLIVTLCSGIAWGIGYTVFLRPQVEPQYNTIDGDGGTSVQVLNPGDTPAYPATFRTIVCRPPVFSIYSSDPARRKETWEDSEGTATAQDITDACGPLWNYSNPSM